MLVLARKTRQSVQIGDVTVSVTSIRRNVVRLAIDAPKRVAVRRSELPPLDRPSPDPSPAADVMLFRVLLIDSGKLEVVYECGSRSEANAWVEEWDTEHLGMPAFVWPTWAPLPSVAAFLP